VAHRRPRIGDRGRDCILARAELSRRARPRCRSAPASPPSRRASRRCSRCRRAASGRAGARTLNFFVVNEPAAGPQRVAQQCSRESGGRYRIAFQYQDLSLAIQRAVHPVTDISPTDATPTYERLHDGVEQAVERRGLL
jgi:hypothetical protein